MLFLRIERKYTHVMGGLSDPLKRALVDTFTVTVPGFWFAKSQMERKATALKASPTTQAKGHSLSKRAKAWDGTKKFINKEGTRFPTGLLELFTQFCFQNNIEYQVTEDLREFLPYDPSQILLGGTVQKLGITYPFELYPFQQEVIQVMAERGNGVILVGTGGGKSLHPDTEILLYDGTIKKAKHILVGDLLMGDDSTPRTVLRLGHGFDEMFEIKPVKGEPYIVNKPHILCLKLTNRGGRSKTKNKIIEVEVSDYLNFSKKMKHIAKGYRVGVTFPEKEVKIPPYLFGYWLGDGNSANQGITTADSEIINYLEDFCNATNFKLSKYEDKRSKGTFHCNIVTPRGDTNPLLNNLRYYGVLNNKHIPLVYKTNSRKNRIALIAGIIDSDGHVHHNFVEVTTKSHQLATDIAYVCRSLGFAAYIKPVKKGIKNRNFVGTYYKVSISGILHELPTILPRKKLLIRNQVKDVLKTGINVTSLGIGEYYGFTLDGNGRFLLGDFTVTHNTEIAAGLIKKLGTPRTLFLTHRNLLSSQTIKRLQKRLGIPIGLIGGDIFDIQQVTVGMVPTLYNRIQDADKTVIRYINNVQLAIGDEIHLGTADSWLSIFKALNTCNLYGLSGTPWKNSVVDDMQLMAEIGPEIFKVPTKWLIDNGYLTPPVIKVVPIKHTSTAGNYADTYKECVVNNTARHNLIKQIVALAPDKQTLVLVTEVEHGKQLHAIMKSMGAEYISGRMQRPKIDEILERFAKKEINILISTPLLDVGVDIPTIDRMVLCNGAGKAITAILQRIGRSLRLSEGKIEAEIFDIADIEKQYLLEHFNERMAIYADDNQQFKIELLDILNQFPQQNLNY